jgi:hypothetical protein
MHIMLISLRHAPLAEGDESESGDKNPLRRLQPRGWWSRTRRAMKAGPTRCSIWRANPEPRRTRSTASAAPRSTTRYKSTRWTCSFDPGRADRCRGRVLRSVSGRRSSAHRPAAPLHRRTPSRRAQPRPAHRRLRADRACRCAMGFSGRRRSRAPVISRVRADALRPDNFIGALGRDDIACVLSVVGGPQIALLAAQKVLRILNAPLWLGEEEIFASPSIGIAVFLGRAGSAELMMRQAKTTCHSARESTGRIALYDEAQDARISRLVRESQLRSAVPRIPSSWCFNRSSTCVKGR